MNDDDPAFADTSQLVHRCVNDILELARRHRETTLAFAVLEGVTAGVIWSISAAPEYDLGITEDLAQNVLNMVYRLRKERGNPS